MRCLVRQKRFQHQILTLLNPNVGVATSIADCVSRELNRDFARISDEVSLLLEEPMVPARRNQQKPTLESKVLQVCLSRCFATSPRRLSDRNSVLLNDPRIDGSGIFSLRNFARDVKEVPVADVGHSELLHEARNACCFAAIIHRSLSLDRDLV
jgi:hypothetical protein